MRISDWSSDVCSSDLGIPLLFTHDVIHGHRTIFPLPLGLACAWDPDLVRRTARVAAMEAAAEGITLAWAPMLDVARDARWGRCAESPGEDPLLCAAFGTAMIERSEEHTSELQSLMRISYAVFCLKKTTKTT